MFDDQLFTPARARMYAGDTLVLYTDGISEAENDDGDEYGRARLQALIEQRGTGCPMQLVDACKQQLDGFRGRSERFDDETLLAIQYAPTALHGHDHRAAVV